MKKKLLPIALLCMLGIGVLAGCGHKEPEHVDPPVQEDVHVTGVSLNKETLSLGVGRDETLVATVAPADATDKSVTWSSADAKVATVADGKVTAVGVGETDISVVTNDGKYSAKCRVSVVLENVQITITNADQLASGLNAGGNMPIELSITPAVNINEYLNKGYLKIESSDTSVISISGTKAYGLKAGTAKITVSLFDGKAEVTCNVLAELPEPAEQKVTVSELIAAWDSDKLGTQLYVIENVYIVSWNTGKTDATKYGNFFVADSLEENAESILVYGATASTQIAQEEGEPLPVISWNGGSGTYAFQNPQDFLTNETTKDILLKCKVSLKVFSLEYNGKKELNGIITAVDHSTEDHTTYPEPELVTGKTLAEFFADTQGNGKQLYEVTGIVSAWKEGASDGTQYGNFYLKMNETDEASYYIYGATATASALAWNENSGAYGFTNPKDFLTNEVTKDIHLGDTVTMKVTRCDYNGTLEGNGIITAVQAAQHEEIPEPAVEEKTLAEFIALENKADKSYKVAATVKAFKSEAADQYGNMTLTDGENDLVIYGATATATALAWNKVDGVYGFTNPKDFLTNELTSTIVIGSQITMQLIRADYKGTVQGTGIVLTVAAPAEGDAVPFGEEYSWNPATSQSDIPGSVLTDPDKYYYWNDQNWCGSNVVMNKAVNLFGTLTFDYSATGNCDFGFQLFYKNTTLTAGQKYTLSLKVTAKNAVTVKLAGDGEKSFDLAAGEETLISKVYTESERASLNLLAPINGETANVLTIKEVKWEEYEEPVAGEKTITLDFAAGETEGLKAKADIVTGELNEVKIGDVTYNYMNGYQGSYNGAYYLMLNSKGYKANALFANKTALGVIKSVEITTGSNASDSTKYAVKLSETAVEAPNVEGAEVVKKATTQLYKFDSNETAKFFSISCDTAANGQLAKVVVKYVEDEGGETPDPIVLPKGRFLATAQLEDDSKVPVALNIGETITGSVGTTALTATAKSYNEETGEIVLETSFGLATMKYDAENNKMLNFGVADNPAHFKWNYGFSLFGNHKSWDMEDSIENLRGSLCRRYGSSSWTLDAEGAGLSVVDGGVTGKAIQVQADASGRFSLTGKDFEKFNARNIQFWVKGDASFKVQFGVYTAAGFSGWSEVSGGDKQIAADTWTFLSVGFSAKDIVSFHIIIKTTSVNAMFDDIVIY